VSEAVAWSFFLSLPPAQNESETLNDEASTI
jgi:hypothetical protein